MNTELQGVGIFSWTADGFQPNTNIVTGKNQWPTSPCLFKRVRDLFIARYVPRIMGVRRTDLSANSQLGFRDSESIDNCSGIYVNAN